MTHDMQQPSPQEQLLRDLCATRVLLQHGFVQGCLCDAGPRGLDKWAYCLDGAIAKATGFNVEDNKLGFSTYKFLKANPRAIATVEAIFEHLPEPYRTGERALYTGKVERLHVFNDEAGRVEHPTLGITQDPAVAQAEVLAILDATIASVSQGVLPLPDLRVRTNLMSGRPFVEPALS